MSVGRDGASDAVSFLEAGIPAVEFGPAGAGHHGPEEWVSISSLARYRQALCDFVRQLPRVRWPRRRRPGLRAVEGGLRVSAEERRARRGAAAARPRAALRGAARRASSICLATAGAVSATVLLQVDEHHRHHRARGPRADRDPRDRPGRRGLGADDHDPRLRPPLRGPEAGLKPRSDTILLVRLDPDKEVIAVTSVPRDLLVDIPGLGDRSKINAAYEDGGERLTVQDGQAAAVRRRPQVPGQPRRHRRLRRLPARRSTTSAASTSTSTATTSTTRRARRLRGDRHRPRLPEALRQDALDLRPLPPQRQRPRPRRPPAGLPAPGAQRAGHAQADRARPRPATSRSSRAIFARYFDRTSA